MKDKYIIIDIRNMDYMKNEEGKLKFYNSLVEATTASGMYEFENVWVCKLIHNHIE